MRHIPVLKEEILELFQGWRERFIDATLGAGGHAAALLEAHPEMHLIGFEQDPMTRAALEGRFEVVAANFREMKAHVQRQVDGILFDLGVSSMQLDVGERGFSFSKEAPLDMRMDPENNPLTAKEIVNHWSEEEIRKVLQEMRNGRSVARKIVEHRPFETTRDFVGILPYPPTLFFQCLRIAVNDELGALQEGLELAVDLLRPGGRMAVISFHSLEDRIVKEFFQKESCGWEEDPTNVRSGRRERAVRLQLVTKSPITPSREEVRQNRRSRSAKLRVAERK